MYNSFSFNKGRFVFFSSIIIITLLTLFTIPRISIPLGLAFFVTLIIRPLVPALVRLGINKIVAYFIVVTTFIFAITIPIINVIPKIKTESEKIQDYIPQVEHYVSSNFTKLQIFIQTKFGYELNSKYLHQGLDWARNNVLEFLFNSPNFLASALEWVLLIPLFSFFMLKDSPSFKKKLLQIVPNTIFERTYFIIHQFNLKLGDYIFAKFVEATFVGLIITIGLAMIDVRFALILGLIAGVTNIVPYVGPLLGMIPGLVICLVDHGTGSVFLAVSLLYLVANLLDLAIIFPILVSKIVDLHPVIVVISVILGSQYLGIIGMVISVPVAAILKLTYTEIFRALYPAIYKQNS
jgi:putative permease